MTTAPPIDRERRASLDVRDVLDVLWLAARLEQPGDHPSASAAAAGSRADRESAAIDAAASDAARAGAVGPSAKANAHDETARASARDAEASLAAGGLYPRGAASAEGQPVLRARPLRIPAGSALPNSLPLVRALRPLPSRRPSRVASELDEAATVEATARSLGRMIPVVRARPERWFEAALVIDHSPSVELWAQTIIEIERMLVCAGLFRDVRTFRLEQAPAPRLRNSADRVVPLGTLNDPGARRIVFFFSAGVSRAWNDGTLGRVLAGWGRSTPVVLLHALPPRLWPNTALGEPVALATNPTPGGPNTALDVRRAWWARGRRLDGARFPVPVLALSPDSVARWAQMFVARRGGSAPAFLLRVDAPRVAEAAALSKDGSSPAERGGSAGSSAAAADASGATRAGHAEAATPRLSARPAMSLRDRIDLFRGASPDAFRLAVRLAVGPFTIPILHLVQASLFGQDARHANVAEVMLSGLVIRRTPPGASLAPDDVEFELVPEAATVLLASLRRDEAREMAALLRAHIEERFGCVRDQGVLWAEAGGADQLPASARPFAQLSDAFVQRLRAALPAGGVIRDASRSASGAAPAAESAARGPSIMARPADEPVVHWEDESPDTRIGSLVETFGYPRIDRPWLTGVDILWVDDHPENNDREREALLELGATLFDAGSTAEALAAFDRQSFDIVLTDIARPEGAEAGLDLIQTLRARNKDTPIIIFASRRHIQSTGARAEALGAFGSTSDHHVLLALTVDAARHIHHQRFLERFMAATGWMDIFDRQQLMEGPPLALVAHVSWREPTFDGNAQRFVAVLQAIAHPTQVHLVEIQGDIATTVASLPAQAARRMTAFSPTTAPSLIGRTFRTARAHWVSDSQRSELASPFAAREQTRSILALPLFDATQQVRLVLSLDFVREDALSSAQIRWLSEFVRAYASPLMTQWEREQPLFTRSRSRLSYSEWRRRRAHRLSQVCRIENRDGLTIGTGFLVGPDLVMTSRDVLLRSPVPPTQPWQDDRFVCVFDAVRAARDRARVGRGDRVAVADGRALVDMSPADSPSTGPRRSHGDDVDDKDDDDGLDYAVLRLRHDAGRDPVVPFGATPSRESAATRGWIDLTRLLQPPEPETPLILVRHRDESSTGDRASVIDIESQSPSRARLWYHVEDDPSPTSGAPCFTPDWDLAAIHQKTQDGRGSATAISAIVDHLWRRERFDIIRKDPTI